MDNVWLRPARKGDAADLAILDDIAGHGISLWFWQKAVTEGEGHNPLDLGRKRFADETAEFGWKNATVAEDNECILGSATSYLMMKTAEDELQFKRDASAFVPIFELFDRVVGDWFVDSLAVYSDARGHGVGSMLIEDSLKKGKEAKATQASLVVEDSNRSAMKIYESHGFRKREARPYIEYNGPSPTREWLLLTAEF